MSKTVYVFSIGAEHTNARYFARVINALDGWRCVYIDTLVNFPNLTADDIFFYVDPAPAWPLGLESLPCVTIAYLIDVHQDLRLRLQMAQFFDAVFIAQKDFVQAFHQLGHRHAHWLPLACEPGSHNANSNDRPNDVAFVGKLGMRGTFRYETLSSVLPKFRTNNYLKYYSLRQMEALYSQSKIVFNASINGDVNMRVFEAMASGALLVTDRIGNGMSELFEEGTHYIGYSTVSEAVERITYFLANNEERERIATAAQRLVVEHHTYSHCWDSIWKNSDNVYGHAPARSLTRAALGELYAAVFVGLRQPWRILSICLLYGLSCQTVLLGLKAGARWLNSHIPLTSNAIKVRLSSK